MIKVKTVWALLATAAMAVPVGAAAESLMPGVYAGAGYVMGNYDNNDLRGDASPDGLFGRVGYQLNDNLAVEGRLGGGVQDDTVHNVKVEMKDFFGAYFKVGMPTTVGLYPYVIAGATHAKVEARNVDSSTRTDLSYGLGADYWFNPGISADLEYAKYFDKDGAEFDGFTVGVNFRF